MFFSDLSREWRDSNHKRRLDACVPWDPKIKWTPELNIKADSYTMYNLFPELAPTKKNDIRVMEERELLRSPSQNFLYCVKVVPRGFLLDTYYGKARGTVLFDGPVLVPAIHARGRFDPWMSLTPMEMITLRGGVRAAKGHTVIAGLGLGYQLIEISNKKSVKKVTLVEVSQELVDWILPRVKPLLGPAQLEVIVGDAEEVVPKLKADVACIDIYPDYGGNEFTPECPDIGRIWVWGTAT